LGQAIRRSTGNVGLQNVTARKRNKIKKNAGIETCYAGKIKKIQQGNEKQPSHPTKKRSVI